MNVAIKRINLIVAAVLAAGALVMGLLTSQAQHTQGKIDPSDFHGTYLETPRTVNDFSLTGVDNQAFDNRSLEGHWTILFFGFTNCGYLCPTTMAELAKMYRILEQNQVRTLPRVVMVSIDPERDTLDKLKHYVTSFQSSFYGARGEEQAVKLLTREMGVAYTKVIDKNNTTSENYDIQHSGALMLFNPQGELNAFFTTPHRADLLAKDYIQLVG